MTHDRPTELCDSAVRRLFDKKLHTWPAFDVVFASRGKARTQALRAHLLKAQAASRKAAGTYPDAAIHVRAMPSHQHAGLQVADYCLWALQRLFTRKSGLNPTRMLSVDAVSVRSTVFPGRNEWRVAHKIARRVNLECVASRQDAL